MYYEPELSEAIDRLLHYLLLRIATAYINAEAVGVSLSFQYFNFLFLAGEHDEVTGAATALASAACV